ncbi:MAG: GH1 family beta-glucosidase [Bacteroidia bacterium]|nr:GH1 family beta-glucosidase [Bacteroidia bacterium]
MERREWLIRTGITGTGLLLSKYLGAADRFWYMSAGDFAKADFGPGFKWGVTASSYQTEGAWNLDGKGESNWDYFSRIPGKIQNGENADVAADFYHRYSEDIDLIKAMNFQIFRFSVSWPRILPAGTGAVNNKGVDFYHRVIDKCLSVGIEPWITIYHWDMPQVLETQGGWANRKMIDWFSEYVDVLTKEYGSKVKNWIVMNEQLAFTGNGYMYGVFAPGRKSIGAFMKSVHHAVLCNAEGGRIIRKNVPGANIGFTLANTYVEPVDQKEKNIEAAARMDAIMNRLFLEPALGLGYPVDTVPILKKMRSLYEDGDEEKMKFDFDFIGIQYYYRTIAAKSIMPGMRAKEVMASDRGVPANTMGGEIYPEGLYQILKKFSQYKGIKNMIVTENGTCVPDKLENGQVHDKDRIEYFKNHLSAVLKAKKEGVNVNGYFVWSPTDNFEWDKGFSPRFGLVYIDFKTLERCIKDSGLWFKEFLNG